MYIPGETYTKCPRCEHITFKNYFYSQRELDSLAGHSACGYEGLLKEFIISKKKLSWFQRYKARRVYYKQLKQ